MLTVVSYSPTYQLSFFLEFGKQGDYRYKFLFNNINNNILILLKVKDYAKILYYFV